jgi:putative transposase
MISPDKKLGISRQCTLLGLARSSFYYKKRPVSRRNFDLMKRIDEIFTENPDFGSRQIANALKREGLRINRKRVRRLMRIMEIRALFPGKNLSKPGIGSEHKVYP